MLNINKEVIRGILEKVIINSKFSEKSYNGSVLAIAELSEFTQEKELLIVNNHCLDNGNETYLQIKTNIQFNDVYNVKTEKLNLMIDNIASNSIIIEANHNSIKINNSGNMPLSLLDMEYSTIPEYKKDNAIFLQVNSEDLVNGINRIKHFKADKTELRQVLKTIHLENEKNCLSLVCCNGKAMAKTEIYPVLIDPGSKINVNIPFPAIEKMLKFKITGQIKVSTCEEYTLFRWFDTKNMIEYKFIAKNVNAIYPNYKNVMPSHKDSIIEVKRDLLLDVIKKHNTFNNKLIKLESIDTEMVNICSHLRSSIDEKNIIITAGDEEYGTVKAEIKADIINKAEIFDFYINTEYFLKALTVITDKSLTIDYSVNWQPIVIHSNNLYQLIMPIRPKNN